MHSAYRGASPTIMLAAFPESVVALVDERAEWEMQAVIDLVSRVRNIRSEMNIKPGDRITVLVGAPDDRLRQVLTASIDQLMRLTVPPASIFSRNCRRHARRRELCWRVVRKWQCRLKD